VKDFTFSNPSGRTYWTKLLVFIFYFHLAKLFFKLSVNPFASTHVSDTAER
jgi:hypothetical protein